MSKKLSQEELQKIWDIQLLNCWRCDSAGWSIAFRFLDSIDSDTVRGKLDFNQDLDWGEIQAEIVSYKLKRCLDFSYIGDLEFRPSGPARAFVAKRCARLGDCLWSGKHTLETLLDNIDNFKWRRLGKKAHNEHSRKRSKRKHAPTTYRVEARELTKKHHWNVVK